MKEFIISVKAKDCIDLPDKLNLILKEVEKNNKVLIIKNFLTNSQINCILEETKKVLSKMRPGKKDYSKLCSNFYHMEKNTKDDDQKRINNNEPLRPRNQRVFKLLPWHDYNNKFINLIKKISVFRNQIGKRNKNYGLDINQGYFNFVQVIQYQPDLGYISKHNDKHFYDRYKISSPFEMLVMLSTRGKEYHKGGLFVEINSKKIDLEKLIKKGDIVVYNVKNNHGVEKIAEKNSTTNYGPRKNSKLLNGRISLLVTPYLISKTLNKKSIDPSKFKSWIH